MIVSTFLFGIYDEKYGTQKSNWLVLALKVVLGSLYQDELEIESSEVVSLLAAASLLQLDAIILKCCEVMAQTVNIKVYYLFH